MVNISKRLAALEKTAKAVEKKRRLHDPFVFYQPWSITLDEYYVKYYPEGLFKKPQEFGPIGYNDVRTLLQKFPGKLHCQISMGECSEWLFTLHHFSERAKRRSKEMYDDCVKRELEAFPELSYLMTDEGEEIVKIMQKLPQVFFVQMKDLQQTIKEA